MLPDFIKIKSRIDRKLSGSIQERVGMEGVMSLISKGRVHEGHAYAIQRADGSRDEQEFREHRAEVVLSAEDLLTDGPQAVQRAMDNLLEQLSRSTHQHIQEGIEQATKAAGTNTDAGGQPFSAELFLDSIEKTQLSFDANGDCKPPTIVIHPSLSETVERQLGRLEREPGLRERMNRIIDQQRDQWRDREANRKLVD